MTQHSCLCQHPREWLSYLFRLQIVGKRVTVCACEQVLILHQLASALEAMHRHRFATPVLHPLSLASIHLSNPGTPAAAARIMPYAHVPSGKAAPLSPIISMLETLCVPPETTATTGLMDEAKGDVWRVAAIAAVCIAGGVLYDCLDDTRHGDKSLLEAALTRLARRGDDRKVSANLLKILKARLHPPGGLLSCLPAPQLTVECAPSTLFASRSWTSGRCTSSWLELNGRGGPFQEHSMVGRV